MRSRILAILVTAAFSLPAPLAAQGKGQGKAPDKPVITKTETPRGKSTAAPKSQTKAPDAKTSSNKGGDERGRTRATEAQGIGKGAEQRGFATPKGLSSTPTSKETPQGKTAGKGQAKEKAKDKDKEKDKEKVKDNNKDKSKTQEKEAGKSKGKGKS